MKNCFALDFTSFLCTVIISSVWHTDKMLMKLLGESFHSKMKLLNLCGVLWERKKTFSKKISIYAESYLSYWRPNVMPQVM